MNPHVERKIELVVADNIERYVKQSTFTSLTEFEKTLGFMGRTKKMREGKASTSIGKIQEMAAALDIKTIDLLEDWSE